MADLVHLQLLLVGERHAAGLAHEADRRAELRPGRQTGLLAGQALLQRPHWKQTRNQLDDGEKN